MNQPAGIGVILFDADGVVQQARTGWRELLGSCVPREAAATFLDDVFAAEVMVLTGGDFAAALQRVLDRWHVDRPVLEVLQVWDCVQVDSRMITAIQRLRRGGLRCYLATNQQSFRRGVMRSLPWYDDGLDGQFYSCELGLAKPDPAYFTEIVRRLQTPATEVLFLDDNARNVGAARAAGLHAELFPRGGGVAGLAPLLSRYVRIGAS